LQNRGYRINLQTVITEPQLPKHLLVAESRHQMYLKATPFNVALMTLDCLEDTAAARLLGLSFKTIQSARDGNPVSDVFMANTMAAFRLNADRLRARGVKISLDEFFEEGTREQRAAEGLVGAVA
jgi:hypothetical protein